MRRIRKAKRNSLPNPFAIAIVDPFATVEVFAFPIVGSALGNEIAKV